MRKFYKITATILLVSSSFAKSAFGQTGVEVSQFASMEADFVSWLNTTTALGGSLAISFEGKLLYARSFGKANKAKTENMLPDHMMRVASVSKPLASIAIMKLLQDGQISLTDKVFGPTGILNDTYYYSGITVQDPRMYQITVQHLLEHSSGFGNTNLLTRHGGTTGAGNLQNHMPELMARLGEGSPGTEKAFAKFVLSQQLATAPGANWNYDNTNFVLLSLVVSKKAGMPYAEYLAQLFRPLGVYDIRPSKSLYELKHEREAEYPPHAKSYGKDNYTTSSYGDGSQLLWSYGGTSMEAAFGAMGWAGSPKDFLKVMAAIDGYNNHPDILSPTTRGVMLTPSTTNSSQLKSWFADGFGFVHAGDIGGSKAVWGSMNGWAYAAIINGDTEGVWDIEGRVKSLVLGLANTTRPSHDLFLAPKLNASNVSVANISSTSATINWTNGDGGKRLVVVRATNPVNGFPIDGANYTANPVYGNGTPINTDNYVVYNGTGNSVTITNLAPGTLYHVRVIEYNQASTNGNIPLYLLGENPVSYFGTTTSGTFSQTIQAETQTWSQAVTETTNAGYTGASYVNTNNVAGSWIEFTVTAPSAGTYVCNVRYANSGTDRPANVIVNNTTAISAASFPSTGSWTSWQLKNFSVTLNSGVNKIRLVATTNNGAANIDKVDISGGGGGTPITTQYTLTTAATNGTIVSNVNGNVHAVGSKIVLTAYPAQGYMFTGWSGAASGKINPLVITLDANKTVTANFAPYVQHHLLTAHANEGIIETTPQGVVFPHGTVVTAKALPNYGYVFTQWENDYGTTNPITFTMTGPKTIAAWWRYENCFEAESALGQSTFAPYQVQNDASASNGQFIVVPNGTGNQSTPSNSIVKFDFTFPYKDTLYVWIRTAAPTSNDNRLLFKFDNESYTSWDANVNTSWNWKRLLHVKKGFDRGNHSLYIARNEDGLKIDKIAFTNSEWMLPEDLCVSSSARMEDQVAYVEVGERFETNLSLAPNPATDNVRVLATLKEATPFTIEVFSVLGEKLHSIVSDMTGQGTHTFEFDASSLNTGIYLVRMSHDNQIATKTLIKK